MSMNLKIRRQQSCVQSKLRTEMIQDVNSVFCHNRSLLSYWSWTQLHGRSTADVCPAYAAALHRPVYTNRPFRHQRMLTKRRTISRTTSSRITGALKPAAGRDRWRWGIFVVMLHCTLMEVASCWRPGRQTTQHATTRPPVHTLTRKRLWASSTVLTLV